MGHFLLTARINTEYNLVLQKQDGGLAQTFYAARGMSYLRNNPPPFVVQEMQKVFQCRDCTHQLDVGSAMAIFQMWCCGVTETGCCTFEWHHVARKPFHSHKQSPEM